METSGRHMKRRQPVIAPALLAGLWTLLAPDNLALAGSPVQWAVLALVVVVVFAPRLLPPLARLLGTLLGMEARRRLRLPSAPSPTRRTPNPLFERSEGTEHPITQSLHPPISQTSPPPSLKSLWWIAAVVCGAVAVLLWYLLHTR